MTRLFAILFVFVATAWAGSFDDAKASLQSGKFPEALDHASKVKERDADYARARYLAGEVHLMIGETDKAVDAFRAGLKAKPDAEPLLTGLGRALLARNEFQDAVPVLEKAVKSKRTGRALCFLGIAQMLDSGGDKGGKTITLGLKLAPHDPVAVQGAVLYWLREDEPARAAKVADRFRKKHKKHPLGHFLKALALEQKEEYDDAIEAYQKAISLDANYLDAHKNLSILCLAQNHLYQNQKRTAIAMKHLAAYRKLGGKDAALIQIHETLKKFIKQGR